MPLIPKTIKTWQRPIWVTLPTESTAALQHSAAAAAMCNALLAPPKNPCTMLRCSDSVSVNTAGVNLITDKTKIVASNSGNRSWFVVQHPSAIQLCAAFDQAATTSATFRFSTAAGFTGGTLTARPTATDEIGVTAGLWFSGTSGTGRFQLVLMHSTDGTLTYGFIVRAGIILSVWWMGQAICHHSGWSPPLFGWVDGAGSNSSTTLNTMTFPITSDRMTGYAAAGQMFLRQTNPYANGQRLDTYQSARASRTNRWQFWPIGLACLNSPRRGKHGRLIDLYRLPSGVPPGWIFPSSDGKSAWMSLGSSIAIPWVPDEPARVM